MIRPLQHLRRGISWARNTIRVAVGERDDFDLSHPAGAHAITCVDIRLSNGFEVLGMDRCATLRRGTTAVTIEAQKDPGLFSSSGTVTTTAHTRSVEGSLRQVVVTREDVGKAAGRPVVVRRAEWNVTHFLEDRTVTGIAKTFSVDDELIHVEYTDGQNQPRSIHSP